MCGFGNYYDYQKMTKWFTSRQKGIIHWEEKAEKTKELY